MQSYQISLARRNPMYSINLKTIAILVSTRKLVIHDNFIYFYLQSTQAEWRVVFYITAAIYVIGAILFCILAEGEIQPWVRPYMVQEVTEDQANTDFHVTPSTANVLEEEEDREATPC